MGLDTPTATTSKAMRWAGYAASALPALMLLFSGVMKLLKPDPIVESFVKLGYLDDGVIVPIGVTELLCTALYLVPRTSVLGAILLTGYLGGATATHVRVGEGFAGPVVFGVLVWLGLYLRDSRLRALVPLRS